MLKTPVPFAIRQTKRVKVSALCEVRDYGSRLDHDTPWRYTKVVYSSQISTERVMPRALAARTELRQKLRRGLERIARTIAKGKLRGSNKLRNKQRPTRRVSIVRAPVKQSTVDRPWEKKNISHQTLLASFVRALLGNIVAALAPSGQHIFVPLCISASP